MELEAKLRIAKIIDEEDINTKTVGIGNKVKVLYVDDEDEVEYSIVSALQKLTYLLIEFLTNVPIATALIGRKKGNS